MQFIHIRHIYLGLEGIGERGFLFTGCGGGGDWVLENLFKLHNQVSERNDNPTLLFAITSVLLHSESQSSRGF